MSDNITAAEQDALAAGWAALRAADWAGARAAFTSALAEAGEAGANSAPALDGLGIALWWLNEIDAAHRSRTAAFLAYKQQGEFGRAAVIAAWLAREQVFLNSNPAAMNGWFARAERLLPDTADLERAWVALYRVSMLAPPAELEQESERALAVARRSDDAGLEGLALAFGGLARVSLGRVTEGMARLDEAMTMALGGEIDNFMVISEAFCVLLSACMLAGDLARTELWRRAADDFARRYHCSFLSAYCRTTYGSLLAATGLWDEAETALMEAIAAFERGHRGLRIHATLSLADLRVVQGRLEEAETLLTGNEDFGAATTVRARLHLARGESDLALAVLDEALGRRPSPMLEDAPLLALLVDARLAHGDTPAAGHAAEALAALAEQAHSDWLLAAAELARGHVARLAGPAGAATGHYRAALRRLEAHERSLTAGRARLAMARALRDSDWAGAVTWARAALASFERLGARRDADEAAALLRELGSGSRPGPRARKLLTRREAEVLALLGVGLANREIAARLVISPKTVEHHVSRILDKLGLRNRAEAAAYAASRHAT